MLLLHVLAFYVYSILFVFIAVIMFALVAFVIVLIPISSFNYYVLWISRPKTSQLGPTRFAGGIAYGQPGLAVVPQPACKISSDAPVSHSERHQI